MRVLLLAGGIGKRLRPLTYRTPKPLIKIGNKPCLEYILSSLSQSGFNKNILSLYYKPDMFSRYVTDPRVLLVQTQTEDLGTAGALKNAGEWLSDPFGVWNCDTISNTDLNDMLKFHKDSKALGTVFTKQDLIHSGGVYIFNKEILDYIPTNTYYSLHQDLIPKLIKLKIPLKKYKSRKYYYYDIGAPDKLEEANGRFNPLSVL